MHRMNPACHAMKWRKDDDSIRSHYAQHKFITTDTFYTITINGEKRTIE